VIEVRTADMDICTSGVGISLICNCHKQERKGERQRVESPSLVVVGIAATLECENEAFRLLEEPFMFLELGPNAVAIHLTMVFVENRNGLGGQARWESKVNRR
jgi:hypothetical protein